MTEFVCDEDDCENSWCYMLYEDGICCGHNENRPDPLDWCEQCWNWFQVFLEEQNVDPSKEEKDD